MVKVTVKGEVYSFDPRYPMAEAIALEEGLGMTFGAWQQALGTGSAKAMAGYLWLVLRRNGRDVALGDILSGKFELNSDDFEVAEEGGEEELDPTVSPPSSDMSGGSGSVSSPKSSGTPRVRSTGSRSTSSTT
jgi:hypothetical protein